MQKNPTVSIVIPVYNRPDLLRRALISVEKQTFTDWECIIVDDGSTDNTADVANSFVKKDERFKLIKNPHGGGNKAMNDGVFAATGKYITLLGSDDELDPKHLEFRVHAFVEDPDLDLIHGGFIVIGDEMVPDKRDIRKQISLYDPEVNVGGTSFGKREVFRALNGFTKIAYASDSDFVDRAIKQFNVKRVSWPTYIYHRETPDSATERFKKKMGITV